MTQVDQTNPAGQEDKLHIGLILLSFLIPIVGIVLFFIYRKQFPAKAKTTLIVGLIGMIVAIVLTEFVLVI